MLELVDSLDLKSSGIYSRGGSSPPEATTLLHMIIVEVTFKIDPSLTKETLTEKFLETAPIYKTTPGLIKKNYISDLKNNIAGGIYCFDNMLNAKKWFDDERIEWITNRYSKPKLKFYKNYVVVDNESKKIISDDNL